jgi:hypothetical protein
MDLPISRSEDPASKGVLHYSQDIRDPSLRGIFAFSFYLQLPWGHPDARTLSTNTYLQGMQMYVDSIQREGSVFEGWKIVLYTDKYTIDWLTRLEHPFVRNPTVILCVVEWPYYQQYTADIWKDQVNGDILRCMRIRSFFDFSSVPVFMRDADTIWAIQVSSYSKRLPVEAADVYEWEANYLRGATRHPNTFIFGTSLAYKRFWHENKQDKRFAPLGAFAGLQSTMPTVPCFQSLDLWEQVVAYLLARSKRLDSREVVHADKTLDQEYKYSDEDNTARIGKDEQSLAFILLPACISNTFFFELDLFDARKFTLKGKRVHDANYAALVFERGNNSNLRRLFMKAIETEFKTNLELNREQIESRNSQAKVAREKEILEAISALHDPLKEYTRSRGLSHSLYSIGGNYNHLLYKLLQRFTDPVLQGKYEEFRAAERKTSDIYFKCIDKMMYGTNTRCLDELQVAFDRRAQLARELLDAVFAVEPRETLLASKLINARELKPLLDWYDGVPLAPPAPPPAVVNPGKLAGLFKKKGGKTKRRTKRKGRTRKN